jgi:hypothetical protein
MGGESVRSLLGDVGIVLGWIFSVLKALSSSMASVLDAGLGSAMSRQTIESSASSVSGFSLSGTGLSGVIGSWTVLLSSVIASFWELAALCDSVDKTDLVSVFVSRVSEETGLECFLVLL